VAIGIDLLAWTRLLALEGDLAKAEPGTVRYRLLHVGARLDLPFAANVVEVRGEELTRVRWGGSLLEEARLHASPKLLTVAPHTVAAEAAAPPGETATFSPALSEEDTAVRVVSRVEESAEGVSLREAKVVVGGGRGVGSAEGFASLRSWPRC